MRHLFPLLMVFLIINLSVGNATDQSGFSGYAWGTPRSFVIETMHGDGYMLLANYNGGIWYRGKIFGEKLQMVYFFENEILISGTWFFDDLDHESYWKVNESLRKAYNSSASLSVRGNGFIESVLEPPGSDARIVHRLNVTKDEHIVLYYYHPGED